MTVPERLSDETRERLRVLTERHTVGITTGGAFCGSGFVVTPDTVITRKGQPTVTTVTPAGQASESEAESEDGEAGADRAGGTV
ncbi:hypothetical protein [Streptomyces sp. NPDC008141]|uniref:hypothetical protein n=1 Tax=Streptomyces sp. NPDC008141 TaxID=3364815 RepID=UPI0036DFF9A1